MVDDKRKDDARAAIERAIDEYGDVFVNDDEDVMRMPVLAHWVLVTTHDDALDPTLEASFRINRKNMGRHETVGLLSIALDDTLHPRDSDGL